MMLNSNRNAMGIIHETLSKADSLLDSYAQLASLVSIQNSSDMKGDSPKDREEWLHSTSVGVLFDRDINIFIDENWFEDRDAREIALSVKEYIERHQASEFGVDSLLDLSLVGWAKLVKTDIVPAASSNEKTSKRVGNTPALENFVQQLAKDIPDACIRLNSPVKKIILLDESDKSLHPIRVIFGQDGSQIFRTDHILFTPSLGVMKRKMDEIFEPSLPQWKQEAVNAAGYGHISKIFMIFEDTNKAGFMKKCKGMNKVNVLWINDGQGGKKFSVCYGLSEAENKDSPFPGLAFIHQGLSNYRHSRRDSARSRLIASHEYEKLMLHPRRKRRPPRRPHGRRRSDSRSHAVSGDVV